MRCSSIALGTIEALKLDPKGELSAKVRTEWCRFVRLYADRDREKAERKHTAEKTIGISGLRLSLRPDLFEEPEVEQKPRFRPRPPAAGQHTGPLAGNAPAEEIKKREELSISGAEIAKPELSHEFGEDLGPVNRSCPAVGHHESGRMNRISLM